MPRLRHVFLDNLFGNINHRERHEMLEGVRANGGGRCTANVMLPVLYPRFRRRTRHRRPADRRLVDSRENDAFHSPCFVLGLFYIRDVEQLKSCLSFSISLSRADVTISRFLSWNWLSYCFWVFLKTIFIRILDSLFDNLPKLPEGSGKIQQCEKELRESLCHTINSDWGTIRRV